MAHDGAFHDMLHASTNSAVGDMSGGWLHLYTTLQYPDGEISNAGVVEREFVQAGSTCLTGPFMHDGRSVCRFGGAILTPNVTMQPSFISSGAV